MGTTDFAVPTLEALSQAGHRIMAVYTQPDRPSGRGLKISEPPVKQAARKLGLEVRQPASLRNESEADHFGKMRPDLAAVVAYGLKLPASFLSTPRLGAINLHPSLLPRYRGAAPINWTLINGESKTGLTVIRMSDRMDAGDIILQQEAEIFSEDNAGSLESRLAAQGAGLMVRCLDLLDSGRVEAKKQDEALATAAPKLKPQDRVIDWNKTSRQVQNLVRGLTPKPGAQTRFRGKILEIAEVREISPWGTADIGSEAGRLVGLDLEMGPLVRTADGLLALIRVRPEGKRLMSGSEFVRGYRPEIGERLG